MTRTTHFAIIALSCVGILNTASAADDARALLQQCLPEAPTNSYSSRVSIDITYKNTPPETHHYLRQLAPQRLLLSPERGTGYGLYRIDNQAWLYNTASNTLEKLDDSKLQPGLFSELLFDIAELKTFDLMINSHNHFGGQDYYTVIATNSESSYPKRSLSFKQAEQHCNLIRAVYFDANIKLAKKLFFQWQTIGDDKLLKALHIEDVGTLEAIRYHIEEIETVSGFKEMDWPATSSQ